MTDKLETEAKYAVPDPDAMRERLLAAGAEPAQLRTLEINLRLDSSGGELRAAGVLLRLRQDSHARLTLKLPVGPWGTQAKTLRELELEVSDLEIARQILSELNYHVWFTYEKYRETYSLTGAEISVDELPFGSFIEIEGSLEQIAAAAALLGLDGARRITAGYVTLFQEAIEGLDFPARECTFAAWSQYLELER